MANCKGISINARLDYLEEHHGPAGLRDVLASLSPEHQQRIEARILPHAWTPVELFIALSVAADAKFGSGDFQLCVTMGSWAAEKTLPRLFKIFYRLGTPMFIFGKAAKLWTALRLGPPRARQPSGQRGAAAAARLRDAASRALPLRARLGEEVDRDVGRQDHHRRRVAVPHEGRGLLRAVAQVEVARRRSKAASASRAMPPGAALQPP
jgi:hypothetical protein